MVDHKDLLLNYGDNIFSNMPKSKINKENLLKISIAYGDKSIELCVDELADILRSRELIIFEYDIKFNSVTCYEKRNKTFVMLELYKFVNNHLDFVYRQPSFPRNA